MTTLDPEDGYTILINTFRVQPEHADALLEVLTRATAEVMPSMSGFVSANFHVSDDRTRVVNYAQWRDGASLDAMLQHPDSHQHLAEANRLADSFEPVRYELRYSQSA